MLKLNVNGQSHQVDVLPDTPLLWVLRDAIATPSNEGRRGHPVGFSSRYRAELLALQGDAGARRPLERDRSDVVEIAIDSNGIFADIDFPGDLKYL